MLALHCFKFRWFGKVVLKQRYFFRLPSLFDSKNSVFRCDNRCWSEKKENFPFVPQKSHDVVTEKVKLTSVLKRKVQTIEKENILTVPNILCGTRIACSPYLGFLIYEGQFNLAFYLIIIVGLTDVLDGFIARTFKSQASKFGTFLDPLADKVLITTTCVALACVDLIPLPLTVLILSRDIALIAAGFYIRYKSLPPPKTLVRYFDATHATAKLEPTGISKFNSLVQLAAIGVGIMSPVVGFTGHPLLEYLWYFTASTTAASAVSYLYEIDKYKFGSNLGQVERGSK